MGDYGVGTGTDSGNCKSPSSIHLTGIKAHRVKDLGNPFTFERHRRKSNLDTFGMQYNQPDQITKNMEQTNERNGSRRNAVGDPVCHVNVDSLGKLKDSTRKLLLLLEEIQNSTTPEPSDSNHISNCIHRTSSLTEEDDCSIYKRLTRKCHCMNNFDYNDLIIYFNETTRYFTSTFGEIIKNIRIVKKFIYMGGDYSKHALIFLNEGLTNSSHVQKVDIVMGCAYADVCNVFDDLSLVIVCILEPCKHDSHGDATTQALAATFLNKLALLEEGRRYLKFTSKIDNDLKKVVRKYSPKIEYDTLERINETLNLLNPPLTMQANVTYYCKPVDEGFGGRTVNTLLNNREYMTLDEVYAHLDLLNNLSTIDNGKSELASFLPTLLELFKCLLMEYDDSEMNIIVTSVLNNVVKRNMIRPRISFPKTVIMAEIGTDSVTMKDQTNQVPLKPTALSKRKTLNKFIPRIPKSNRFKQPSKLNGMGWKDKSKSTQVTQGSSFIIQEIHNRLNK